MNLSKAANKLEKFVINPGEDEVVVYAYPWRVTDKFMKDNGTEGNTPIAQFLPLVLDNWNLEMDVVDLEHSENSNNVEMEEPATATPQMKTIKIPITEEAIRENVPLWLQSEIWGAILRFEIPNPKKSNP